MRKKCQRCRQKKDLYGWFGLKLCNHCITYILDQIQRRP